MVQLEGVGEKNMNSEEMNQKNWIDDIERWMLRISWKFRKRYPVAICCIIKDENLYLKEWIEYHIAIGVSHFFVYDNDSKIPVAQTIKEIGYSEKVTVTSIHGPMQQVPAYAHCLKHYGHQAQWIAFIDMDEFIVPKESKGDLPAFLKGYRQYGGLGVNWLIFGSSGWIKKPEGSQLESFLHRSECSFEPNRHIKSIVQPRHVKSAYQPHYFRYKKNKFCVNEKQQPIYGHEAAVSVTQIQINHYYCRSLAEYVQKIERGRSDIEEPRIIDAFYAHDRDANVVEDHTIVKLWDQLKVTNSKEPLCSSEDKS